MIFSTKTGNKLCSAKCRTRLISLILAISTIFLFFGGPDYESPRSVKAFWNIGHLLYFALAAWRLSQWQRLARLSRAKQWLTILILTLLVGILIEMIQSGTDRSADAEDVVRDFIGSFLFLSFSLIAQPVQLKWKRLLQSTAVLLVLWQLWPLFTGLVDEIMARQRFPILADFEMPFEQSRWEGNAGDEIKHLPAISDSRILEIPLTTERFSGVNLKYFPGDWRNYQSLVFEIYHPQNTPLWITCRIHDRPHTQGMQRYDDRFNRRILLQPGWNSIEIDILDILHAPRKRDMDLEHIAGIGLFVMSLKQPQKIYLDNLRLSK